MQFYACIINSKTMNFIKTIDHVSLTFLKWLSVKDTSVSF